MIRARMARRVLLVLLPLALLLLLLLLWLQRGGDGALQAPPVADDRAASVTR